MPNVSRSRPSWSTSLRTTARMRPSERITARLSGVAATNTSSRLARVTSTRASTWARASASRTCPAGSVVRAIDQRVQARSELRDAQHRGQIGEHVARGAQGLGLDLDHVGVDVLHQLARRALGHQPPPVEDGQRVAALRLVHVVGRDEDRGAPLDQREERLPEVAAALGIDGAGGLVEEQQLGLVDRGGGQGQALSLAARERPGALAGLLLQAVLAQQLARPLLAAGSRQRMDLAHEVEVLEDGQILVEREALGHVADRAAQAFRLLGDAEPQHFDLALARCEQAAQHADGGGLARSVRSQEAVDLRARNREIHVVDGHELAEAPGETVSGDRRGGLSRRHGLLRRRPPRAGTAPRRARPSAAPGPPGLRGPPWRRRRGARGRAR